GSIRGEKAAILIQCGTPSVGRSWERGRQDQGQIQPHIDRDIRKDIVIANAEPRANHGFSIAEETRQDLWVPGNPKEGSIIVIVRADLSTSRKEKIHRSQRNGVAAQFGWVN